MKKLFAAAFLLGLLFLSGCSSTPSGTDKLGDVVDNAASRLGQKVIVVGSAETKTGLSTERLFKIFNEKGTQSIWVMRNEETEEPPEAAKVRVEGTLQQKEFHIIGKVFYIDATSVVME
jgi:hypothetical protein